MDFLSHIRWPGPSGFIEILVLAVLFYYIMSFFKGTRGASILSGFILTLVLSMLVTKWVHLDALNWIFTQLSVYLAIAFVVIFQPEIRHALAELGKQPAFSSTSVEKEIIENIVQAVLILSEKKTGALIAVEREIGTRSIQETGTLLDSQITVELLTTIFFPYTALHDGGVIIGNGRLLAAGCLFPLSQRADLNKNLGTRHRAAIGLTEETDAIVVVVSEETGKISLAYRGHLTTGLSEERLRRALSSLLIKKIRSASRWSRAKEKLDLTPEGVARTDALAPQEKEEHAS